MACEAGMGGVRLRVRLSSQLSHPGHPRPCPRSGQVVFFLGQEEEEDRMKEEAGRKQQPKQSPAARNGPGSMGMEWPNGHFPVFPYSHAAIEMSIVSSHLFIYHLRFIYLIERREKTLEDMTLDI